MWDLVIFIAAAFGAIALVMFSIWGLMMLYKSMFKGNTKLEKNSELESETVMTDERYPYQLNNPILSTKEKMFYKAVKPIADELNLIVFTKVRLADILIVPKDTPNFMKWFNYIKAKHIDFVFVDNDMRIKVLIEVDDKTHNRADRKERDETVDKMFAQLNIEVLHIWSWGTEYGGVDLKETIIKSLNMPTAARGTISAKN